MRFEEAFCPRHVEYYGKDLSTISQASRADIKIDCSGTFFRATPFLDGPGSVLSRRIWQKQLGLHLGWEPINTNSTATFDQGQQFLETLFMFGAQEICEDQYFRACGRKFDSGPLRLNRSVDLVFSHAGDWIVANRTTLRQLSAANATFEHPGMLLNFKSNVHRGRMPEAFVHKGEGLVRSFQSANGSYLCPQHDETGRNFMLGLYRRARSVAHIKPPYLHASAINLALHLRSGGKGNSIIHDEAI